MPVKPDVHVKEEPEGPALKRCRPMSPTHMVLPSIMEMIAALGPGSSPFPALPPPAAPAPAEYSAQGERGAPRRVPPPPSPHPIPIMSPPPTPTAGPVSLG